MSMFVKDPGYLGHTAQKPGPKRTGWWDSDYRLRKLGRLTGLKVSASGGLATSNHMPSREIFHHPV